MPNIAAMHFHDAPWPTVEHPTYTPTTSLSVGEGRIRIDPTETGYLAQEALAKLRTAAILIKQAGMQAIAMNQQVATAIKQGQLAAHAARDQVAEHVGVVGGLGPGYAALKRLTSSPSPEYLRHFLQAHHTLPFDWTHPPLSSLHTGPSGVVHIKSPYGGENREMGWKGHARIHGLR
ncbi:hypothetical protein FOL47_003846 [Perkinsus chesapeaki]|uniref:Uncharacterized protein n=1 Tax=Perkinsus chesapeaki TaxID=330153 RepID=A0A7J6M5U0_PERCH|nr:hypothetical protein FOL47_003846 [Perkinsus chesapeaki]